MAILAVIPAREIQENLQKNIRNLRSQIMIVYTILVALSIGVFFEMDK